LEDLSAINYRLQGLAEKKPETQEIMPMNRSKIRVRSIKGCWLVCVIGGIFLGVSWKTCKTQGKDLNITRKDRGLNAKRRGLFDYLWTPADRERPRARPRWGEGRRDRGDAGEMLTTGGDEGKQPESWPATELGWPALSYKGRQRSGTPPATESGGVRSARCEDASGVGGLLREDP
jgi:hypothetical protein